MVRLKLKLRLIENALTSTDGVVAATFTTLLCNFELFKEAEQQRMRAGWGRGSRPKYMYRTATWLYCITHFIHHAPHRANMFHGYEYAIVM